MGMMNVPEMQQLARVQRFDFWIAVSAIAGTLLFGVLAGCDHRDCALVDLARVGSNAAAHASARTRGRHAGVQGSLRESRGRAVSWSSCSSA